MDTRQLALITDGAARSDDWRLDEHTRQVGLRGVAAARRALREARAQQYDDHRGHDDQHHDDHEPHAA